MKKIVVLFSSSEYCDMLLTQEAFQIAESLGFNLQLQYKNPFSVEEVEPDPEAEAVITTWGSPKCNQVLLEKMPALKIVGHAAGSVRQIFDPVLYQRGVTVLSANPVMAHAVAEWSLMMTLLRSRNFFASSAYPGKKSMDWKNRFNFRDLKTSTLGFWGFGDTTRHLLAMFIPLRPKRMLVASAHASEEEIRAAGAEKVSFEMMLGNSQHLHCLVGINAANYHKIGAAELAMMPDGATIYNCGRATLIQEAALLRELASGRLHAVLDVFPQEPLPEDSELFQYPNLIMTPHNAGFPGRELFVPFLLRQFKRYFQGQKPEGMVPQERFEAMTDESLAKK
ncbi:MAG: hydroxyacid dehydrogenase [Oligosphaeraceae bacterium]|nr:hydroxyacid dehydrogenase [Oligosphaeraceae bacterium]